MNPEARILERVRGAGRDRRTSILHTNALVIYFSIEWRVSWANHERGDAQDARLASSNKGILCVTIFCALGNAGSSICLTAQVSAVRFCFAAPIAPPGA